jgi:hypothetical protein
MLTVRSLTLSLRDLPSMLFAILALLLESKNQLSTMYSSDVAINVIKHFSWMAEI